MSHSWLSWFFTEVSEKVERSSGRSRRQRCLFASCRERWCHCGRMNNIGSTMDYLQYLWQHDRFRPRWPLKPLIVGVADAGLTPRLPQSTTRILSRTIQPLYYVPADSRHLAMLCSMSNVSDSGKPLVRNSSQLHLHSPWTSSGQHPFLFKQPQALHWWRDIVKQVDLVWFYHRYSIQVN